MNKRIEELAELAGWAMSDFDEIEGFNIRLENYTELLIKEILSYAEEDGDLDFMKFMVKKNFGVEE